jgi:hypothetical protein
VIVREQVRASAAFVFVRHINLPVHPLSVCQQTSALSVNLPDGATSVVI